MAKLHSIPVDAPFSPLEDDDAVVIGRSAMGHGRIGRRDLIEIGAVCEAGPYHGRELLMDARFPHIVFICGKRGSGKSYSLGVVAEGLASSRAGIGVVIVDPVGVFWSMRYGNRSKTERAALRKWGLEPAGLENLTVMAPAGFYSEMRETVDAPFSISVADMTAEDWCAVFDIDRFKVQGLLIGSVLQKVRDGYKARTSTGRLTRLIGHDRFELDDIIACIERDQDIQSRERGFAPATRRSVIARFEAARPWGIFQAEGTPMDRISVRDQVTIIDVSHQRLGENTRALVVGILARKILEARIQATRAEDAEMIAQSPSQAPTIPVTWLLIDEAHLMLPHKGETPATMALVEYAKLGRKPGCALVLSTQRPAATNDDVLSQVDIMIGHNLALEDDITALRRRMPAKMPAVMADSDFIRGLPVGVGIIADQQTQNRSFVFEVRPRRSHHGGRQAVPTDKRMDLAVAPPNERRAPVMAETTVGGAGDGAEPEASPAGPEREEGVEAPPEGMAEDSREGEGGEVGEQLAEGEGEGVTGEDDAGKEGAPADPAEPAVASAVGTPSAGAGTDLSPPRFTMEDLLGPSQDGRAGEGATEGAGEPANPGPEGGGADGEEDRAGAVAAFAPALTPEDAGEIASSKARGLFGRERLSTVELVGLPMTKVTFRYLRKGLLGKRVDVETVLWDRMTGEVATPGASGLKRSQGLPLVMALSDDEVRIFLALSDPGTVVDLAGSLHLDEQVVARMLDRLAENGLVRSEEGVFLQTLATRHRLFSQDLPPIEEAIPLEELFQPTVSHHDITRMVGLLYHGEPVRLEDVMYPYYRVTYVSPKGRRVAYLDGIRGTVDGFLTKFLG
ncbi:MAG: DUF87 domain-containing protein [Thermoplasmata archaeon]|nr:DUF87 domain-containing protein [Thermoplasmata archaeon]